MMSNDVLIEVKGLSKKFCRSLKRSLWYGVLDVADEIMARKDPEYTSLRKDEFWALEDVHFQLRRGESMGLIGRNGAGKTTLLRLMNGLIKPSAGSIAMRGRVQAIISLGVGFNPILTGRENILIYASVLGFRKSEIDRLFDDIVAFAELDDFMDMPVQNYSAGMKIRLGFSVAAHMEPEILLVDEVLAVGDDAFRRKALLKMQAMLSKCTLIFVSHNMNQVEHICQRSLYLRQGRQVRFGPTSEVIREYIQDASRDTIDLAKKSSQDDMREGSGEIRFTNYNMLVEGKPSAMLWSGQTLTVRAGFLRHGKTSGTIWYIAQIWDLASNMSIMSNAIASEDIMEEGLVEFNFPNLTLRPRAYAVTLVITDPAVCIDRVRRAMFFSVSDRTNDQTRYSALFKKDIMYWPGENSITRLAGQEHIQR